MDKKELMTELEGLKSNLEVAITEKTKSEIAEQLKAAIDTVDAKLKSIAEGQSSAEAVSAMAADVAALKADNAALIKGFDLLQTRVKSTKTTTESVKSFAEAFNEGLEKNFDEIAKVKKGQPFTMSLKAVGNMLLSANLTGDGVASYSGRQAILPAQKVNFRDLIPTAVSPTGLYVQYQESGSEGALAKQTEGSSKGQIDYDFTEIKVVESYIAGFARFSKQMAKQLPYMQSTLPRLLMRDFYKKENGNFYATVTGALTPATPTETDDIKAIMDLIATQQAANFNASYALVNPLQMARLNKLLYTNGYYPGSGGVVSAPNGAITIGGTPVISASWVTDDKVLIFDADYLERVETESVNIEFSMDDSDNFTKNLITARIECQEEINLMLATSAITADLGNV